MVRGRSFSQEKQNMDSVQKMGQLEGPHCGITVMVMMLWRDNYLQITLFSVNYSNLPRFMVVPFRPSGSNLAKPRLQKFCRSPFPTSMTHTHTHTNMTWMRHSIKIWVDSPHDTNSIYGYLYLFDLSVFHDFNSYKLNNTLKHLRIQHHGLMMLHSDPYIYM